MSSTQAFRELNIQTVQNGFVVTTSRHGFREGYSSQTYVFPTIAELSVWIVKQDWKMTAVEE